MTWIDTAASLGTRSDEQPWWMYSLPHEGVGRDDRVNVLLEQAEGAARDVIECRLDLVGYRVTTCSGPESRRRGCPLARGKRCSLVEDADVIVNRLGFDLESNRAVLADERRVRPDTPIVVEVERPKLDLLAGQLEGCTALVSPATNQEVLDAVAAARARPRRNDPSN